MTHSHQSHQFRVGTQNDPLWDGLKRLLVPYKRHLIIFSVVAWAAGGLYYKMAPRYYMAEMSIAAGDYAMASSMGAAESMAGIIGAPDLMSLNGTNQVQPLSLFLTVIKSPALAQRLVSEEAFAQIAQERTWEEIFGDEKTPAQRVEKFLKEYASTVVDFSRTVYKIRLLTPEENQEKALEILNGIFEAADDMVRHAYERNLEGHIIDLQRVLSEETLDMKMRLSLTDQLLRLQQKKAMFSGGSPVVSFVLANPALMARPVWPVLPACLFVPWLWGVFIILLMAL